MDTILSIDQGTTGSRAIIFDKESCVKASAYQEFKQYFPKPGWVEHDPEEIWDSVYNSVQKVLHVIPSQSIKAIGITNQRETTVVWDKRTGYPVCNAIVWQCRRSADRCEHLKKQKGSVKFIRQKTGLPIDAYFSATKLEWILNHIKGARALALKNRLCFGTTDSWVMWKLTGGAVHATDFTNASRTMLFDIRKKKWSPDLLKKFHIPFSLLPQVKNSSGIFGFTSLCGKLREGIPISGVAGDQQAALFGQACFKAGSLKNTYGTGAFMLLNTGRRRIQSKYGLITTLGCGEKGEPVYVLEGAIFIAGAAIQWLRDGLGLIKKASQSERIAVSLKGTDGVYFVPAFVGMGAPYWNSSARGAIVGITRGTKSTHIIRSALEAMCYQSKDVLLAMQKDSGLKIKSMKVDGGAVANDFLCQYQADILGCRIVRPEVIETTSLGAAYLAGLAVGFWKNSKDILKNWKQDRLFIPKMNRRESDRLYEGWKRAVHRVLL